MLASSEGGWWKLESPSPWEKMGQNEARRCSHCRTGIRVLHPRLYPIWSFVTWEAASFQSSAKKKALPEIRPWNQAPTYLYLELFRDLRIQPLLLYSLLQNASLFKPQLCTPCPACHTCSSPQTPKRKSSLLPLCLSLQPLPGLHSPNSNFSLNEVSFLCSRSGPSSLLQS